jgi:hypothetical protein
MQKLPHNIFTVISILLVGIIGSYLLVFSKAAERSGGEASIFARFNITFPAQSDPSMSTGQTATAIVQAMIRNDTSPQTPQQVVIDFRYNPAEARLLSVECITTLGCTRSASPGNGSATGYKTGFVVCIDTPPDTSGANADMYALRLQNLRDHTVNDYQAAGTLYWWSAQLGTAPGSCASNPTANGVLWTEGRGYSCNSTRLDANGNVEYTYPPCDSGSDIGNVGFTNFRAASQVSNNENSQFPLNTGQQPVNTNSKSTNGGSTANKQSNQSNTIPSSSSQGTDNPQSEINPSPFYDGKQYDPGSDPDVLGIDTTFSVAGHNLKYGWVYVLAAFILGLVAFFVGKKPKFLTKLNLSRLKLK